MTTTNAPGRIIAILGQNPALDVHEIASRAERQGRTLILVVSGPPTTPEQDVVISEVAHLAWSWFDMLSFEVEYHMVAVGDDDEVIVAAAGSERRALEARLGPPPARSSRGSGDPLTAPQ